MPKDPSDIVTLWTERASFFGEDHNDMDTMVNVYHGGLPQDYNDYFHEDMKVHLPNMIRLAWDDLANMAGKEFPIYVDPDNATATAQQRGERQEQIAYGWNEAGRLSSGVDMKLLMKVLSWWMVGCASAVAMVLPDFKRKTPFFTYRDPRTYFPPVGWSPYSQSELDDVIFGYQLTIGELKRRYPDRAEEIGRKLTKSSSSPYGRAATDDRTFVWLGEYYHEDSWQALTLTEPAVTLVRSDSGDRGHPGVQPVVPMTLYSPNAGGMGRSIFADQVSIQAALARMFSQKLDFYDRTLYPIVFHTPLSGPTLRIGAYATNEYNVSSGIPPRVDTVQPAHPIDADQTMAFAIGLARVLNRNPEMMQGAGEADSAKAMNELKAGITSTVKDGIWPNMLAALPRLYAAAASMDIALWGNMSKKAVGTRRNSAFRVNYVPSVHLRGREEDFRIEPGLGLGGYQGTLEIMQLVATELVSEDTALEQLEDVREPQEEKRRIQAMRTEKLIFADLAAKAQSGLLMPGALGEAKRRVLGGEDLFDVIDEMEKAGRLTAPQQPMMPGMPGAPPMPGGGGGEPIIPTMQALGRP